jgi:hypothetical protein
MIQANWRLFYHEREYYWRPFPPGQIGLMHMSDHFRPTIHSTVALALLGIIGCLPNLGPPPVSDGEYRNIVLSARTMIPTAVEMERLFPVADHSVPIAGGPVTWTTKVFFGGRFQLLMQVDVKISRISERISKVIGEPEFRLWEVQSLTIHPDGRVDAKMFGEHERAFGLKEWSKIVADHGAFTVLGLSTEGPPVNGFDAYAASRRMNGSRLISLLGK